MRKITCCFSLILIQGLFFCTCFAEEGLKVFTPKQKAELASQFIDENKLLVSALDAEGNPIRGLGVEDFVIEREKRTAKILSVEPFETTKEIGLNLVLVVDNSFSMSLREAVGPLLTAVEQLFKTVRPIDNIHVVVFDKNPRVEFKGYTLQTKTFKGYPLHARTFHSSDASQLKKFLSESFEQGLTSNTYLHEAMVAGIDLIREMPEKGNKFLVVFSDGEDLNSGFNNSVVLSEAEGIPNFEAYCIDYMPGPSVNSFLRSFAKRHSGRVWKAKSTAELIPIFQSFSTTLLYRYIVTYRFLNPPQGTLTMEPTELNYDLLTLTDGSPVSNDVFFARGKSEIPRDYVLFKDTAEAQRFDDKTLKTALDRYYNVLNIIGKHLNENPTAQVRIVGCNAGIGVEEDNLELSRKRAEAVKLYLNNIWAVNPERMEIGIRNLPSRPSRADVLGGPAENQRVEIEYTSQSMQQGVADEFIVEAGNAGDIKIYPQVEAEYGIADWELNLLGDDQPIMTLKGTGELKPAYAFSLTEFGKRKMATLHNVQALIKVTDNNGDTHETATAPVVIASSPKEVIHELVHPPFGQVALEPSTVTIQELTTIDSSPMLNYVFFDTGKSGILARYAVFTNMSDTRNFSEKKLRGTMEKYYHILDVIGKRLKQFPEAGITIVGCNSDYGVEQGRIDLSQSRAEAVRAYLKYIWGIELSRMTIEARNLPVAASTNRIEEGRAENQRVEIYSDFPAILEPIKSTYVEEMSDTEAIRVLPKITAGYGIAQWRIELTGDGVPIASLAGEGDLSASYAFDLKGLGLRKIASFKEIEAAIEVIDENGTVYKDVAATSAVRFIKREEHIAQRTGYKVLEKYALVLFDFGSSYIKGQNKTVVDQIVGRMNAFPEAVVEVVGHTDNIGKEDYNLWLSERRAKSVFDQITAGISNGSEKITHAGSGLHNPLYDNTLPEGRAFNRTVTVSLGYETEDEAPLTSMN